jgi:hypothetical protein
MKGVLWDQKLLMSVKAKVHDLLASESHELRWQKIYNISAALEALVYGAEMISTSKCRQFQVCLKWARQEATTWLDADRQQAIERLQHEIHQVTAAKYKLFNRLFLRHERQLWHEVGTRATSPQSKFPKELALMNSTAEDDAYGAANMTAV